MLYFIILFIFIDTCVGHNFDVLNDARGTQAKNHCTNRHTNKPRVRSSLSSWTIQRQSQCNVCHKTSWQTVLRSWSPTAHTTSSNKSAHKGSPTPQNCLILWILSESPTDGCFSLHISYHSERKSNQERK